MALDLDTLLRSLHIVTAALWFGGAILMAFVLGPSFRAAGPAAGPFLMTLMRRGGLSPYFMSVGGVAVLLGFYLYYAFGYHSAPFGDGASTVLTIAALLAVIAYGYALLVMMPNERKIRKLVQGIPAGSAPTAEQAATFQEFGATQGKHSALNALLVGATFVLMTISRLFF